MLYTVYEAHAAVEQHRRTGRKTSQQAYETQNHRSLDQHQHPPALLKKRYVTLHPSPALLSLAG